MMMLCSAANMKKSNMGCPYSTYQQAQYSGASRRLRSSSTDSTASDSPLIMWWEQKKSKSQRVKSEHSSAISDSAVTGMATTSTVTSSTTTTTNSVELMQGYYPAEREYAFTQIINDVCTYNEQYNVWTKSVCHGKCFFLLTKLLCLYI